MVSTWTRISKSLGHPKKFEMPHTKEGKHARLRYLDTSIVPASVLPSPVAYLRAALPSMFPVRQ